MCQCYVFCQECVALTVYSGILAQTSLNLLCCPAHTGENATLAAADSSGGRLVVLMEGGYSLQGLSESVSESFLALMGQPSHHQPDTDVVEPMEAVWKRIAEIRKLHGLEQGTR